MSIRIRLALWFSGVFTVALVFFSLALYGFMARHLDSMMDDAIVHRLDHLTLVISAANPQSTLMDKLGVPSLDAFEVPEVYVQVALPDGTVIARSSNLEGHSLPPYQDVLPKGRGAVSLGGTMLKEVVAPAISDGRAIAWVQVAASYRQRDMVLQRLRWVLAGGGLTAVAVAGLLSALMAGRALAPVAEMADTARAIALSKGFDRRLNVSDEKDELGQLALTFNEMLASLEEAYSSQQQFTANASHELRAPLTAIRGNLELLDRVKDMPEDDRRQTLAEVRREVERLSRLVNDLLILARADAGQTVDMHPVELDALLIEVHRQALAMTKKVSVRLGPIEPVMVRGDDDRLKELFLVLVDNAIRYTPEGGLVRLGLRRTPPWVAVDVEDTGIGIAKEDLPHIFDRFYRADRARSRDSGGTGLGLSIAKWIADAHGGEILVNSTLGKGSRFTVHLLPHSTVSSGTLEEVHHD